MNKLVVYPIGSGSTGNSTVIKIGPYYILIDIGISVLRINESLKTNGLSLDFIDSLLITHIHNDHIKGLRTFVKNYQTPIWTSKTTCNHIGKYKTKPLVYEKREEILKDLYVTSFKTSHDCPGSSGFILEYEDIKVGYATDLGIMTDKIFELLKGSNCVILESNHDQDMLNDGPYPEYLKQRIKSKYGHLSNDDCANTISKLINYGTKTFFLAHLSRENNRPEVALYATQKMIKDKKINVYCLPIYGNQSFIIEK